MLGKASGPQTCSAWGWETMRLKHKRRLVPSPLPYPGGPLLLWPLPGSYLACAEHWPVPAETLSPAW